MTTPPPETRASLKAGHALGCSGDHEDGWCIPKTAAERKVYVKPARKEPKVWVKACTQGVLYDTDGKNALWAYCNLSDWQQQVALPATFSQMTTASKAHAQHCPGPVASVDNVQ